MHRIIKVGKKLMNQLENILENTIICGYTSPWDTNTGANICRNFLIVQVTKSEEVIVKKSS